VAPQTVRWQFRYTCPRSCVRHWCPRRGLRPNGFTGPEVNGPIMNGNLSPTQRINHQCHSRIR
jgi:hypothetical protein